MLHAINCVITELGLYPEKLQGATLTNSRELLTHHRAFYHRDELLPKTGLHLGVAERIFGGARKPVFTTARGTPSRFTILSGDVHYSYAYDVRLRQRPETPRIWQITSSGIKNEFPPSLLNWLDRINRWLYLPGSPLNWFTKRRKMRVQPRLPDQRKRGERLWNGSGIGEILFDAEGSPVRIRQLNARDGETEFLCDDSVKRMRLVCSRVSALRPPNQG